MASRAQPTTRRRDAARSREAILDAAEAVFSREGYDGASLAAIGERARLSNTLAAYFFRDKRGLYDAVIARLFADRDTALDPVCQTATAAVSAGGPGDDAALREGLEILVGGYLDFLRRRPAFVRLMARDALDHGRRATTPRHSLAFQRGVAGFIASLSPPGGPAIDPEQMLITTVALCFFPLEHDATMLAGLGFSAYKTEFVEQRKRHVVDVLVRVLRSG